MTVNSGEFALLLIGAGTTILGTVVAWLLQGRLAHRLRGWAIEDLRAMQEHEAEFRQRDIREERFQRLRSERREVYARVLDGVEEFIAALRDLRDTELPDDLPVSSSYEVKAAHPIAARALLSMEKQRRLDSDVILVADHEVRDNVLLLSQLLRSAFKAAVGNRGDLAPVHEQYKVVLRAMRLELVGPSQ